MSPNKGSINWRPPSLRWLLWKSSPPSKLLCSRSDICYPSLHASVSLASRYCSYTPSSLLWDEVRTIPRPGVVHPYPHRSISSRSNRLSRVPVYPHFRCALLDDLADVSLSCQYREFDAVRPSGQRKDYQDLINFEAHSYSPSDHCVRLVTLVAHTMTQHSLQAGG